MKMQFREFGALQDISFEIYPGEVLGVIGKNGSGKTTLLKIISAITKPTFGSVEVKGRVVSLLELGAGFEPELSGRENIFLYGSLLGLSRDFMNSKLDNIIEFSGLKDFIHEPVKSYSSGMLVRLAFSVAAHSRPRVLLLDEILGVGDLDFQNRCFQFIHRSLRAGVAIVLVSHDMSIIGNFCHRVLCLDKGRIVKEGQASEVVDWYIQTVGIERWLAKLVRRHLTLVFHRGNIHLIWDERSLTTSAGCYVLLWRGNQPYLSTEASWQVLSQDPSGFTAKGRWSYLNITQTWHVRIHEERFINIIIDLDPSHADHFENLEISIMASSGYKRYVTSDTVRSVPPLKTSSYLFESLLMRMFPRRFIGLASYKQDPDTPGILVRFEKMSQEGQSQIFNGCAFLKGRTISRTLPLKNQHQLEFNIDLLYEDEMSKFYLENRDDISMTMRDLEVFLNDSGIHAKYRGDPVTINRGIFVTLNKERKQNLEWEVISLSPVMKLRANDDFFPVVYCWEIKNGENSLQWSLILEVLDILQDAELFLGIETSDINRFEELIEMSPIPIRDLQSNLLRIPWQGAGEDSYRMPGQYLIAQGSIKGRQNI